MRSKTHLEPSLIYICLNTTFKFVNPFRKEYAMLLVPVLQAWFNNPLLVDIAADLLGI